MDEQNENEAYARKAASEPLIKFRSGENAEEYREAMKESGPYLSLGIQMAFSIAIFAAIGYWIDSVNHTAPRWITILTAGGAVLGLSYFIATVLRLSKKEELAKKKPSTLQ